MLSWETKEEITTLVRCGFYDRERLQEIFCEEMYAPGELDTEEVARAIDAALANLDAEKTTWPAVTDCDLLDQAFTAINERGIIALQNAGNTQSDGYSDVKDAYKDAPDQERITGYCFYHGQDLERAVRGGGLYLVFGPMNPKDEETKGSVVGRAIQEELERVGLEAEWDGTFSKRIYLPKIVWQRW
jgi:hypothetical protein